MSKTEHNLFENDDSFDEDFEQFSVQSSTPFFDMYKAMLLREKSIDAGDTEDRLGRGLTCNVLIDEFRPQLSRIWLLTWFRKYLVGIKPRGRAGRRHALIRAELRGALSNKSREEALSRKEAAESDIRRVAINVSTARNKVGMGKLLDKAQGSVQVIRNERTNEHAYVLGPRVLRDLLIAQLDSAHSDVVKIEEVLGEVSDEKRTEAARASFVKLAENFSPIKVDIPVEPGTAPMADISV